MCKESVQVCVVRVPIVPPTIEAESISVIASHFPIKAHVEQSCKALHTQGYARGCLHTKQLLRDSFVNGVAGVSGLCIASDRAAGMNSGALGSNGVKYCKTLFMVSDVATYELVASEAVSWCSMGSNRSKQDSKTSILLSTFHDAS